MEQITIAPITTKPTKIVITTLAALTLLSLVLNSGLIGQENVYACMSTEVAMQCDKLSAVNDDGFQTRCYYTDELEKTRYKNCKTGWLPYTPTKEVAKTDISTKDRVYLLCDKANELVSSCQIVDTNDTVIRIGA